MFGSTDVLCSRLGYKEAQEEVEVIIKEGRFWALFASCAECKPIGENGGSRTGRFFPLPAGPGSCKDPLECGMHHGRSGRAPLWCPLATVLSAPAGRDNSYAHWQLQTPVVWVFLPQGFSRSLQFVPTQSVWEDNPKGQPSRVEIGVPASPPSWHHPEPPSPAVETSVNTFVCLLSHYLLCPLGTAPRQATCMEILVSAFAFKEPHTETATRWCLVKIPCGRGGWGWGAVSLQTPGFTEQDQGGISSPEPPHFCAELSP